MRRVITAEGPPVDADGLALDTSPFTAPAVSPAEPERLRTEFEFELPRGYMGSDGRLHKGGAMRLATARDELLPLMDDRVRRNNAYLTVVLLGRVITRLGSLSGDAVTADVIEGLFASDLAFLQDLYRRINSEGHTLAAVTCPACHERFSVDLAGGRLGES
jgi:hypothetical protein